jgi:hypothetical protein
MGQRSRWEKPEVKDQITNVKVQMTNQIQKTVTQGFSLD